MVITGSFWSGTYALSAYVGRTYFATWSYRCHVAWLMLLKCILWWGFYRARWLPRSLRAFAQNTLDRGGGWLLERFIVLEPAARHDLAEPHTTSAP